VWWHGRSAVVVHWSLLGVWIRGSGSLYLLGVCITMLWRWRLLLIHLLLLLMLICPPCIVLRRRQCLRTPLVRILILLVIRQAQPLIRRRPASKVDWRRCIIPGSLYRIPVTNVDRR